MSRLLLSLCAGVALFAAVCGDDDEGAATTTTAVDTTTTEPTPSWPECENPEGFTLSYPEGWSTNDGSVVGECSQFDPEPFTVPEATDERVAAITAYVDPVPFHEVAAPDDEIDRAVTSVDGREAVRLVESGSEFYGEDVGATRYLVDLAPGISDPPRTLFVDTIELSGTDYAENVEVLDRMIRSIDLDGGDDAERAVVAHYGGGGSPFSAGGGFEDEEPCITVPLEGEQSTSCFSAPGPESIRVADLSGELLPVIGGVAGEDVFRIDAELSSGTFSFLPVRIDDSSIRGWAMPVDASEVTAVTFSTIEGVELGEEEVDGASPS